MKNRRDILMKLDAYIVTAQILHRYIAGKLLLIDLDAGLLLQRLLHFLCGNRTEGSSVLTGLDRDGDLDRLDLLLQLLCLLKLFGCNLRIVLLLKLQRIQILIICEDSRLRRKNKVPSVALRYLYDFTLFTQCLYIL